MIKFKVGKKYYDNYNCLQTCTKRTDKSVWFNNYRFLLHNRQGVEYINGAVKIFADNYDDIEVQRDRKLKSLLEAAKDVCENDEYSYVYEGEEELYELCHDLKECLTEFLQHRVKLDEVDD